MSNNIDIYHSDGTPVLSVTVDDTSYRYRTIMGEHSLTLRFSLAEHIEIPVGAYCMFQGQEYTLVRPEDLTKKHSRNYDYTIVFQSAEFKARIWKFRNPVDGRLKFPLTATPREHLQIFVDNMNRRDTGWEIGNCIEGEEVLINYDHDFCRDALAKMASELNTEYYFDGKRVSLYKLEVNKDNPLPLSYGRGNGFKTGVGRSNSGDNPPTEILYVQGGTDNIDRSKYPPLNEPTVRAVSGGCLLLPRLATLQYDGAHFETEDGFDPSSAHTYVTDDLGLSLSRADKELSSLAEDSLDCSSIYPKRVGEVGDVIVTGANNDLYDFVDNTIPDTLDYSQCIIGDETMTVIFQSGMLAGKEFDVRYCHKATTINGLSKKGRRFEIVPQEIDGIVMPSDCFIPRKGDKYAVFHCQLPDAYINAYNGGTTAKEGAEWDMFRAAVKHMYDAEQLQFTFKGTLDGLWAKKDWENIGGRIVLGGYILFSDKDFEPKGVRVRITGIKDYINNPHSPEIELSNSTIGSSVSTTLKELAAEEVTVAENHKSAVQFTRRRFRDAQETMSMLEKALLTNFTDSINPIGIRTMQMLVGDESLQFEFVDGVPADDTIQHPNVVNHTVVWHSDTKQLEVPWGIIKHLTLDVPKDLTANRPPQAYHYWALDDYITGRLTDAEQKYYLYAKVPLENGEGEFRLETDAKPLINGNNYWLLLGILNSEYDGNRSYVSLYGYTEVLPGRVTTERVVSSNGKSWFDMAAESMKLGDALEFNRDGDRKLILRGTMVQSQGGTTEYIGCYRGMYNGAITYFRGDEVSYQDVATGVVSTYRCMSESSVVGVSPVDTSVWQVIAQGAKGEDGASIKVMGTAIAKFTSRGELDTYLTSETKLGKLYYLIDYDEVQSKPCVVATRTKYTNGGVSRIGYTTAADGDAWVLTTDGHLYVANSASNGWSDIGQFKGDKGDEGKIGDYYEIRYAANGSPNSCPIFSPTALNFNVWKLSLATAQAEGTYVWQTSARYSSDGLRLTSWTQPIRITGINGKNGADGKSPVLTFQGDYDPNKTYYGTDRRVDAVRHVVGNDTTYFVARNDAGEFKGVAPPDEGKWNEFGATFDSIATNLLLAEGANIGKWFISDGRIVSTLNNSANKVTLDAEQSRIEIFTPSPTHLEFQAETPESITTTIDSERGVVEVHTSDYNTAYMSPTGIFINRAGTQCVSAVTGHDQRAAICALGYGNLEQTPFANWSVGQDSNLIAGVYGTSANSSTAPHYGGYFRLLKACGLVLKPKYVGDTTVYLSDTDTLVIGYHSNKGTNVYLPSATREGQTIFVKMYGTGYLRFYPSGGQHIYDNSSENNYFDCHNGQGLIFHFSRIFINNVLTNIWLVSRYYS